MCRNIKPLNNFSPPATDEEIRAAALQFVRKIAGSPKLSAANQAAYEIAAESIAKSSRKLIDSLVTKAPGKNRLVEAEKSRSRRLVVR